MCVCVYVFDRLRLLREAQSYASLASIFKEATASRRQAANAARRARADAEDILHQVAQDVEKAVNDTDDRDDEMPDTEKDDD